MVRGSSNRSFKYDNWRIDVFIYIYRKYFDVSNDDENGIQKVENGTIDFEDVSFHYGNDEDILSRINLHIPSGSTLGILGATGSSKSSLVQLIPRLYDVTQGSVKVAGMDVRDYDLICVGEIQMRLMMRSWRLVN